MEKLKTHVITILCTGFMSLGLFSCENFLDERPSKSLATPTSLEDLQSLLDHVSFINGRSTDLIDLVADDFFVFAENYTPRSLDERLSFVWDKDARYGNGWASTYQGPIYQSNVVLDQLQYIQIKDADRAIADQIQGSALFHRAFGFLHLAQLYCRPYSITASSDLGIVLRLKSDITENSVRATVQQTYDQILNDLKKAAELLPPQTPFPTRPSKAAAYAAIARTYLFMRDYTNAQLYSQMCLELTSELMDFNDLVPLGYPPVPRFNQETIFYNYCLASSGMLFPPRAKIDTVLYSQYESLDLRKRVYFYEDGGYAYFQGSFEAEESQLFDGLTTAEMWLTLAEAQARGGDVPMSMATLNQFLKTRYLTDSYTNRNAGSANEALTVVLLERRKELIFRGLRWPDLRRFNEEGANITLRRVIGGVEYTLPPGDPRWLMLIPDDVITRSGIPQNPR